MPPSSPFSREAAVHPKPGSQLLSVMDRETSQCSTPSPSRAHRMTSRVNDGRSRSRKPSARSTSTRSRCAPSRTLRERNPVLRSLAYGSWFRHAPTPAPGPTIRLTVSAHRDNLRGQNDTLRQCTSFVKFTVRMYRLFYPNLVFGGEPRSRLAASRRFYWGLGIYWRSCRLPRCWIMSSTMSFSRSERLRLLLRMARALRSPSAFISCSPSNAGLLPVSRK
jgi:hypothetical protein